jgi:hypothetical protein
MEIGDKLGKNLENFEIEIAFKVKKKFLQFQNKLF